MTEDDHQAALFRWARLHEQRAPELALLFAIPNGGWRAKATAGRLWATGVKAGVPDLFLPVARYGFHGCFIEMKTATGRLQPTQEEWIAVLLKQHYRVTICRSWIEAAGELCDYLDRRDLMEGLT